MEDQLSGFDDVLNYLNKIDRFHNLSLQYGLKEIIHCPIYLKEDVPISFILPPEPTKKSWLFGIISWDEPNYDSKKSLIEILYDVLNITYRNETLGYGEMLRKACEINEGHARAYAKMLASDSNKVQSYRKLVSILDDEQNLEDEVVQLRVLKRDWLSVHHGYR